MASTPVLVWARGFQRRVAGAMQWIKEGKQSVEITRLSCHRFRSNEVRL
jgi:hypothetical protein